MRTSLQVSTFARLALATALLAPSFARAHVAELVATLDPGQEVPPLTISGAGGTGEFTLEDGGTVETKVTFHDLTGAPIAAHIHPGAVGVEGGALVNYGVTGAIGTITGVGSIALTPEQQQVLFAGGMYFNVHTQQNPDGEIRGQIFLSPGPCPCAGQPTPGAFKSCVKQALRGVEKQERKEASVKQMKKFLKKASCGKTKTPNKKVACCLPIAPAQNIVTDSMCAVLKEKQCTNLGGTSAGAGVPCSSNPCAASPSGAFVEASAD
jgi:hypothetical protein